MNAEISIRKIKSLDLEKIQVKLTKSVENGGKEWTGDQSKKFIEEYKKFLMLILLYPTKSIVPTKEIDEVWHMHILDTQKYHKDCDYIFGQYVHHLPSYDNEDLELDFQDTAFFYKKQFKEEYSVNLNSCKQCHSNCRRCHSCGSRCKRK